MNIPTSWRRALPGFLLMLAAVLLLYRHTGLAMVEIWDRSGTFAHAFVVPPIALWLIWRQRDALAALTPRPAPIFLLPVAAAGLLWLLGDLASANSAAQLAFVALLVLTVPTTLGWPVARTIAFPLGFLFFCVPLGEFMMPQMMEWTADFTVAALTASGVPVYREGLQFVIPSGTWSVVEACSGIRYMIASTMVGTLFAYLNYRSLKRRFIFIGVAIALPLVANWIRAYMIVMLGHLSGNKLATGVDHLIYGWVFFGIVMLGLFMIGARWAEPEVHSQPGVASLSVENMTPRWNVLAIMASLILLIAAPIVIVKALVGSEISVAPRLSAPSLDSQGWKLDADVVPDFKPSFENPAAEVQATYSQPAATKVGLYVAYYRRQGYESKLISSNNVLVKSNDKNWARVSQGVTAEDGLTWRSAELRGATLDEGGAARRLRVRQIYWVNGHWTASDLTAKIYGLLGLLAGQGDDAAVLVVYTAQANAGVADTALERFIRDNGSALRKWLTIVRQYGRQGVQANH